MKRFIISALIIIATVTGVTLIDQAINPAQARDCSASAVAKCGVWSVEEFRHAYNNDTTPGLKNIYNAMGLTSDVINGAEVRVGLTHKDGRVTVGNETVATGANTAGRQTLPGKTRVKKVANGTVYYEGTPLDMFHPRATALESFVFFDKDGRYLGAIIKDCGNPVNGKPEPKPTATCDNLQATAINRNTYRFTANASTKDGATITGYTFDFGDGNTKKHPGNVIDHQYAQPGNYSVTVTVHTSVGDRTSDKCKVAVTVAKEPAAACSNLSATITGRTSVRLDAAATATNGATISAYVFTIVDADGKNVFSRTVESSAATASTDTTISAPGSYTAKVVVKTSLGDKTGTACEKTFKIDREKVPGVSIIKKVDGVDHKQVAVNQPFDYQLTVTNKGETDLTDVKVTDNAPDHVQFISADKGDIENNNWSYTIPSLKVNESQSFTITAKVTKEVEGRIKNTACVDAKEIPGDKDDCDDATVEVEIPPVKKIEVCELSTKNIITIDQANFDNTKHSTNLEDCQEKPVDVPVELPETGLNNPILNAVALSALAGSVIAYSLSRRSIG